MMHRSLLILAFAALATGCTTTRLATRAEMPDVRTFHSDETGLPMRRVAVLPLYHEQGDLLAAVEVSFAAELNKTSYFEVVPISRSEMETITGRRQISSVEGLPAGLLEKLRQLHRVDGVLLTDVTHFFPYRPISMGIRTRLVDVQTSEIRWALDTLYDSANPAVAEAARKFQVTVSRENLPLRTDGSSVLQSPTRFAKFVASETYARMRPN